MSSMPLYVSARVRPRDPGRPRVSYPPEQMWLLGKPRVGQRMALLTTDGGRSMLTSRIRRVLRGSGDEVWVETGGSIYELRPARRFASAGDLTAADTGC
jgi:hypothetical protein